MAPTPTPDPTPERQTAELALLQGIYPTELTHDARTAELRYRSPNEAFTLRLPDAYLAPVAGDLPVVLAAHVRSKDISAPLRACVAGLTRGEEVLDLVVARFEELAADVHADEDGAEDPKASGAEGGDAASADDDGAECTIVVWLHHLLNTNKRKQVLHPTGVGIAGLSKPGYPGVLVFAGPAAAVRAHVAELRSLNWAAFQVRLEVEEAWEFAHGTGVAEVEAMGEVVREIGDTNKAVFLEAMKMKG